MYFSALCFVSLLACSIATDLEMSSGIARGVKQVLTTRKQREGGGFVIRRSVGSPQMSYLGPFLMLDHLGPTVYGPGEALGAPDHPHRGFETVSYVLEGGVHHKDNNGNEGILGPGYVQWMTAGRGIIHSEMPVEEIMKNGGKSEAFQLWVNLPAKDKMTEPRYQDTPPERIPKVTTPDGKGKVVVIAGEALGTKATIDTRSPMTFRDVQLDAGGKYEDAVPSSFEGFVYVYRGDGLFSSSLVKAEEGQYFELTPGSTFSAEASSNGVCFLLIAGQPLNEPVARYGWVVMNTREEVQQAFEDFYSGRFGKPIEGEKERYAATEQARLNQKKSGRFQDEL